MAFETSKSNFTRRIQNIKYRQRYFVGEGIDVGAGANPLNYQFLNENKILYLPRKRNFHFPNIKNVLIYSNDWNEKDVAENINERLDKKFDFLYTSNLMEHVHHFERSLLDFSIVVKENGYLIVCVPDFELYEYETWPSLGNKTHNFCFSLNKTFDIKEHKRITHIIKNFYNLSLENIEIADTSYNFDIENKKDQTKELTTEAFVEFVCKVKRGKQYKYKDYDTLTLKEFEKKSDFNKDVLVIPDRGLSSNEIERIENLPRTDTFLPLADNFQHNPITYPTLYNKEYVRKIKTGG